MPFVLSFHPWLYAHYATQPQNPTSYHTALHQLRLCSSTEFMNHTLFGRIARPKRWNEHYVAVRLAPVPKGYLNFKSFPSRETSGDLKSDTRQIPLTHEWQDMARTQNLDIGRTPEKPIEQSSQIASIAGKTERDGTNRKDRDNSSGQIKSKQSHKRKKASRNEEKVRKTSSRKCNKFARIWARRVREELVRRNGDIWLEREGETKPIMPEAHETRFYFRPKGLNGY